MVSDERSEEFRRSVKESLNGPFQATGSDDTEPEIGIERKNKTYLFSEPANQVYRANVIAVAIPILPDGPFSAVRWPNWNMQILYVISWSIKSV